MPFGSFIEIVGCCEPADRWQSARYMPFPFFPARPGGYIRQNLSYTLSLFANSTAINYAPQKYFQYGMIRKSD